MASEEWKEEILEIIRENPVESIVDMADPKNRRFECLQVWGVLASTLYFFEFDASRIDTLT